MTLGAVCLKLHHILLCACFAPAEVKTHWSCGIPSGSSCVTVCTQCYHPADCVVPHVERQQAAQHVVLALGIGAVLKPHGSCIAVQWPLLQLWEAYSFPVSTLCSSCETFRSCSQAARNLLCSAVGGSAAWGRLDKHSLESCIGVVALALSVVMAGTGHLPTFKLLRGDTPVQSQHLAVGTCSAPHARSHADWEPSDDVGLMLGAAAACKPATALQAMQQLTFCHSCACSPVCPPALGNCMHDLSTQPCGSSSALQLTSVFFAHKSCEAMNACTKEHKLPSKAGVPKSHKCCAVLCITSFK